MGYSIIPVAAVTGFWAIVGIIVPFAFRDKSDNAQ